ncbi:flagellar basal body-associated protein FliL [Cytobacillus sp. S13-E01]|uniref:flagellar basal body-associated protein FliL n=1 Tax=Cytobacillus sp. S13-E01 TaxID=3031326 RepID=UPI0023D7DDA7|nr:flagellar basal body-associated protein FliL [Cytobacillus sp. S13-E01]MDF0725179.1 flagellar basal body-associated protein FliL [Cytobacillus sp. S13-E01]
MVKNKLLTIMLIIISAITLVGTTAFIVLMKFPGDEEQKEPSIDEVVEATVEIPEITTKLKTKGYIRISFNIQTDSKKAKEELEKRGFQVQNILIKELSEMTLEQFDGEEGISSLENKLKDRINELMQEGTIVSVYATSFLPQ